MECIRLTRFGLDGFERGACEDRVPGPGEVVVRWHAASLNYHDLAAALGMANPRMPLPQVPLSDGAGEIIAVGDGVTSLAPGTRVVSRFFPAWQAGRPARDLLRAVTGETVPGVLQQQSVVPAGAVLPCPDYLDFAEAATLPCAALTAWRAVVVEGQVQPGQKVLVQGSGGVSLFAAAFARLMGAEVFAISSSAERLALLRQQGASDGVNYRDEPAWGRQIRKMTGGQGVDLVVEVGGANTLSQSLDAVAIGGHISMIGVLSGVAAPVATAQIMAMNVTVRGITVGNAEQQRDMQDAMALHQVRPVIGERFAWHQVADALGLMQRGGHTGKIVLTL